MVEFNKMRMNSFPIVLILLSLTAIAMAAPSDVNPFIAGNDVIWMKLGTNENDSMPIGNGDLAANVWTEQNGGIVVLIAKSDAWSENGQLLKSQVARMSILTVRQAMLVAQRAHQDGRARSDAFQPRNQRSRRRPEPGQVAKSHGGG
jgi:hypothetical protein